MKWFESWFDTPYYHILYRNHDFAEAEQFITLLTQYLQLPEHSKIIDLACGKGRHSVYLNQLGYDVLGLDLSQKSIKHDKAFENETLHFRVHDMRNPIEGEKVDAVFNLFTSFGYFDNVEDDKKVFQSVSNILKPEGYFVLDFLNPFYVEKHLTEHQTITRDDIDFRITKKIEDHFIIKNIDFEDGGQPYHFFEKVKLHTPEKILNYAEEFGFERLKMWGDYQLNEFDSEHSPRCINLFKVKQ